MYDPVPRCHSDLPPSGISALVITCYNTEHQTPGQFPQTRDLHLIVQSRHKASVGN